MRHPVRLRSLTPIHGCERHTSRATVATALLALDTLPDFRNAKVPVDATATAAQECDEGGLLHHIPERGLGVVARYVRPATVGLRRGRHEQDSSTMPAFASQMRTPELRSAGCPLRTMFKRVAGRLNQACSRRRLREHGRPRARVTAGVSPLRTRPAPQSTHATRSGYARCASPRGCLAHFAFLTLGGRAVGCEPPWVWQKSPPHRMAQPS